MQDITLVIHEMSAWIKDSELIAAWVGALGTVLAIFVTWGLSRAEYNRARRVRIREKERWLDGLASIWYYFEGKIISEYLRLVETRYEDSKGFYDLHLNDKELATMKEFSTLP